MVLLAHEVTSTTDGRYEPRSPRACRNDPNGHVLLAVAPGLHGREHQSGRPSGRRPANPPPTWPAPTAPIRARCTASCGRSRASVSSRRTTMTRLRSPTLARRSRSDAPGAARSTVLTMAGPWAWQSFGEFEYSLADRQAGDGQGLRDGHLRLPRRSIPTKPRGSANRWSAFTAASRQPSPRRTTSRRSARSSTSAARPATCWRTS